MTEKVYKVNYDFHCHSKLIVCPLSCKVCGPHYVGSTVDSIRLAWNNYKCSHRVSLGGGTPKQNYFHQHFLSEGYDGLLEHWKITLIDKN